MITKGVLPRFRPGATHLASCKLPKGILIGNFLGRELELGNRVAHQVLLVVVSTQGREGIL